MKQMTPKYTKMNPGIQQRTSSAEFGIMGHGWRRDCDGGGGRLSQITGGRTVTSPLPPTQRQNKTMSQNDESERGARDPVFSPFAFFWGARSYLPFGVRHPLPRLHRSRHPIFNFFWAGFACLVDFSFFFPKKTRCPILC